MEKEFSLIDDAIGLSKLILASFTPEENWKIVNVLSSKEKRNKAIQPSIPLIVPVLPTSFTYFFSETIHYLERAGVISFKKKGEWFLFSEPDTKNSEFKEDTIMAVARQNNFLVGEVAKFYNDLTINTLYFQGLYAVLVSKINLQMFIQKHEENLPRFNRVTGIFEFKGQRIFFRGKYQISFLELLIDNIGKMVSKKDVYEARGEKDYDQRKQKGEDDNIHESLENIYKEVRRKLYSNPVLKESVLLKQENGFGLFTID